MTAQSKPTILIVDDEPRMVRFVKMNLDLEGYLTLEANNGMQALEKVLGSLERFIGVLIEQYAGAMPTWLAPEQARILAAHAVRTGAKINLIPYNTVEGLAWERPAQDRQEEFLKAVRSGGADATLRREKGHDIAAACGQLRLQVEKSFAGTPPVN